MLMEPVSIAGFDGIGRQEENRSGGWENVV